MAKRRFKSQTCPNCGFRFATTSERTNYCPECGQENYDLNGPIRHLIKESAESVFHFDTKSIHTLKALVFKPGFLTSEFVRGKRARYIKPIRLYIFISFLFFLILSLSSGRHVKATGETESREIKSGGFNVTFFGLKSNELRGVRESQLDSVMQAHKIAATPFNRYVVKQLGRIGSGGQKEFSHLMIKGVSYMMFVLMPFFGFLVYLFFRKQSQYYVGTLVFSVHYHSFTFLLLAFLLLLGKIPILSLIPLLAPIALVVYLYIALRTVYRQSKIFTLLKTMFIGLSHIVSVIILFLLTVFLSLLVF